MLQRIRDNSQGIIAKTIVGLIALTFALFGVESLVGLSSRDQPVAEVNGEDISVQEFATNVERQRRQLLMQMGENANPALINEALLENSVLQSMIEETLLVDAAQKKGIYISDAGLDQVIVTAPEFQVEGRFNAQQFDSVLRSVGYTPLTFREMLRKNQMREQVQTGYVFSSFQTQSQLQRIERLNLQTRDVAWLEVAQNTVDTQIQIDSSEVRALYEERKNTLLTEEQVVLNYVLLEKEALLDPSAVTDAELRDAYQQRVLSSEAEEERSVSHILIDIDEAGGRTQALQKANELIEQLQNGADFSQLAQTHSTDLGSADFGGELGYLNRESLVGGLADAVFNADATGLIENPIDSEFGLHVVNITDIRTAQAPTFEELSFDLTLEVANQKAEQQYVELLERLADVSFASADLEAPADEIGLTIETSGPIGRQAGADWLSEFPSVIEAAFSDDVLTEGLNSLTLELDRDRAVVVHLNEYLPVRELNFDEVSDQLETELRQQKILAQMQQLIETAMENLSAGLPLPEPLDEQNWVMQTAVNRFDTALEASIREQAFAMSAESLPAYAWVQMESGNAAIVRLDDITIPNEDELELHSDMQVNLGIAQGQAEYTAATNSMRTRAEIIINQR